MGGHLRPAEASTPQELAYPRPFPTPQGPQRGSASLDTLSLFLHYLSPQLALMPAFHRDAHCHTVSIDRKLGTTCPGSRAQGVSTWGRRAAGEEADVGEGPEGSTETRRTSLQ